MDRIDRIHRIKKISFRRLRRVKENDRLLRIFSITLIPASDPCLHTCLVPET